MHYATNRMDQFFNINLSFRGYRKYHKCYRDGFVIQLLSEPHKQNVA